MPALTFRAGSAGPKAGLDNQEGYIARPWVMDLETVPVLSRTENEFVWCFECGLISRYAIWEDDPQQCPFCTARPIFCFSWQEAHQLSRLQRTPPLSALPMASRTELKFDDV